jgi:hypothetical protein
VYPCRIYEEYALNKHDRFCGQDEEHDPSEEFEEYLACAVCGDNGKFLFFDQARKAWFIFW